MADNHNTRVLLLLVAFSYFFCFSSGYQFVAGGRDGWILNPSENYNRWAERNRFQVNDTILFQYNNGSNSVLVVNRDDYDKCNTGNPIVKFDDGNSVFKFDRSGPFYFISGNKANCDQGQKLIVVVLAIRSPPQPRPPIVVSPPTAAPPQASSSSPSPAGPGSSSNISPSPAGAAPSPSSGSSGPATSPSSPPPASEAPGPATSTSPGAPSSSITPGAPGSSTPGNVNSPPPRGSFAAASGNPSIVLVSLAMSVVLGGFMV